jgi:hypothetical protein
MTSTYTGFLKYSAYSSSPNDLASKIFTEETIKYISEEVTKNLKGLMTNTRIVVPDENITSVLSNVFENYRPNTQDIYTKYNIIQNKTIDDANYIVLQTIDILVQDIRLNIETINQNNKLTIWTTVLGDNNEHGLRSHDQIKIRKKRPTSMLFHMNY